MLSTMEYVLEQNDKGKHVPQKVGMAPIMRDGVEYEFTTVLVWATVTRKDGNMMLCENSLFITENPCAFIRKWQNLQVSEERNARVANQNSHNGT